MVFVTPCRNEAHFLPRILESVLSQTLLPLTWIIVDDGSSDETSFLLQEAASRHAFIQVLRREDRGRRSVGPGVIEAFNAGLKLVDLDDFDYLCKLDADLELPPRYFEILVRHMEADPRLGTCSGKAWYRHPRHGGLVSEGCGDDVSLGMTKFYRVSCFREIGGFVDAVMWDGIDCHRCRMLGWKAVSWDDPELRFVHLRPMGSSEVGLLRGRRRHGYGQYYMGTSLLWMTLSAMSRIAQRPVFIGAMSMWWGFVWSALRRLPRYEDPEFRAFLRRYQRLALLQGKERAQARVAGRALRGARQGA